ncbi:class I SAM-dependent methyltransferase [Rubrimonas sp.]|uniref:class I SAM-dependent methyltransferase n=1 Tax=Rubrimonas sp. TaxID=2036015 RepID=UPI002FDEF7EC
MTRPASDAAPKPGPTPAPPTKTEPDGFTRLVTATDCLVCGAAAARWRSDYPSLVEPFASSVVRWCEACGSGAVEGARALLSGYYERDYAASNRGDRHAPPATYFSAEYRLRSPKISRYFNRAQAHVDLLHDFNVPMEDVLDFGSGPGYLLHVAQARRKFAYEPDEESAKYLRHIGARRFATLEEMRGVTFDAIVSSHSLEHLAAEDLRPTLTILLGALKPQGKLLIEVPNGGHAYLHLEARNDPHTLFFTPAGIVAAVEGVGGRVLYRKARGKSVSPLRHDPFYAPSGGRFAEEARGALALVCERGDAKGA